MPRHPHEPVTPTLPFPPFPPEPPCGCRPPRMRPEPFSPGGLPAPHGFDFGRWAREKINWLMSLVPSAASADNPLADREWVAGQAVGGKADKVAGATEGNLAALAQDGNLTDSGAKPADFATAAQGAKADTAVQPNDIAGFVDGAGYDAEYGDPPKPTILLKHGSEVVATVDAADFVIDGMVSNVEVKNGNLVITFNTDSDKQPISIPLTDIFNPANYYDKTAADGKFVAKEAGKGLSTEDYTTAEKTKLGGIAAGAQVNVIETVKVNGTALTPQDKAVDIPVPVLDNTVTRASANGVKSSGIWSAIWGALAALPAGFSSLYDWCVAQLAGKVPTSRTINSKALSSDVTLYADDVGALPAAHNIEGQYDLTNVGIDDLNLPSGTYVNGEVPILSGDVVAPDSSATSGKVADAAETYQALDAKQDTLSPAQLANIAAVPNKLDKSGGTMTGTLTVPIEEGLRFGDQFYTAAVQDVQRNKYLILDDGTNNIAIPIKKGTLALAVPNPIAGNLAALDSNGNPVDSGKKPSDFQSALTAQQLANIAAVPDKADKSAVDPLLFAQYYPDGSVKSAAEFTQGIKYDDPNTTNLTITVKPFCNTGTAANDNSDLEGRVVIPPFVDAQGNPYISDDGTRYKVVGVGDFDGWLNPNVNLTAVVVPNTVTNNIGVSAFNYCTALTSVSPLAATGIGDNAFANCESLSSVSLPAATTIGDEAFAYCESLSSVDFGDTPRAAVPSLGIGAFGGVPPSCKIIVPYTQYAAWKAASGWSSMSQKFVRHPEKADKPATFTTGNLAALDADGNPTDSQIPAANVAVKGNIPYDRITITTGQLQDHAKQKVTLNAATTTLSLPALTNLSGKVSDFGIDMVNGYAPSDTPTAASFQLDGTIGTDYNLIVPEGEDWSEMSALAAGEMAVYYFTLSAFQINDKPTWEVMKKVVTLVPVPVAP